MSRGALLFTFVLVLASGVAAYRLFGLPTTIDAPIQAYLQGEMANLKVPSTPIILPDTMIEREDAPAIALNSLQGKAMLINLWASWCAPCKKEMPELANLQRELGDDRFEVVAISVDHGGIEQAKQSLAAWGIEGLALYAEPAAKLAFNLSGGALPASFVVGADGEVKAYYLGPLLWDSPEALELFKALKEGEL